MRFCNLTLSVMAIVLVAACNELAVPLVAEVEGGVVVEIKRLGEYPSAVTRVRLTRTEDDQRLWEVEAVEGASLDLWEIRLERGWNDVGVLGPRYRTVFPDQRRFLLEPEHEYRLDFWGSAKWKRRSIVFSLPAPPPEGDRDSSDIQA